MVINTSERHLREIPESNIDRSVISIYLARMAAVTFYAEMEEQVKDIVAARFTHGGDAKLAHFLSKTNDGLLARMKRKEIGDTVGLFGEQCKVDFQTRIPESDIVQYSNVIKDRHHTSHGEGSDVTLSEVKVAMEVGERILVAIKEVIQ